MPGTERGVGTGLTRRTSVGVSRADVDSCVPYNGNELWTSSLDIPVVTPWRAWMHNKQVAGYATTFESNFQFVTVKGACCCA